MKRSDIHCKIELIKDLATGKIMLTMHLNPEAPNVTTNEHTFSWTPTYEEQHFLTDAITLLQKQQHQPLVTFTKKKNQDIVKEEPLSYETIDSINQTIDNLPTAKNKNEHLQHTSEKIQKIIEQNTKDN